MYTLNLAKSINALLIIYFISTLLFPILIINKLVFVLIIGISLIDLKTERVVTIAPIIIFFIFLFGYINSFSNNVDKDLSLQFFLSVLVLFLIFPINKYRIDLDRIIKFSGMVMAIYTGISYLLIVIYHDSTFLKIFSNYSSGGYGERDFIEGGTISFQLGTSPFLYLPFILFVISYLKNKQFIDLFAILLLLATIFISSGRGLIISCLISVVCIIFFNSKFILRTFIVAVSIPILIFLVSYLITHTNVFSPKDFSNHVKIGHIESFFDNINFKNIFLGDGLASYYYSKGVNKLLAHTEITPLDMLRYLGFVFAPLLYFTIIFPINRVKYYLDNKLFIVIFIIYLLNSFTNPIMFNSFGLLIVLWYWHKIINISNEKQEEVSV